MPGWSVTSPRMPKVRDALRRIKEELRGQVENIMRRTADEALLDIRQDTPRDTGRTADLWYMRVIGGGGKGGRGAKLIVIDHPFNVTGARHPVTKKLVNGTVNGKDFNLLLAIENGTAAHLITPKTYGPGFGSSRSGPSDVYGVGLLGPASADAGSPGYLRFKVGGRWVTTREVHHPGTIAYYPVANAAKKADDNLVARLQEVRARAAAILDGAA